jgi:hypothetical protein
VNVKRFIGIAIVAICIGSPIVETFDHWDSTLQSGDDTEANLIIVALCVGTAIATERLIAAAQIAAPFVSSLTRIASESLMPMLPPLAASPTPTASPPIPLRV